MKTYMPRSLLGLFILIAVSVSGTASAKEDLIYTATFSSSAAAGYDVTAYFSESKPVKGKKAFTTEFKNADWYFASQENLDKFVASPETYAPQYGGYCAWAVSQGKTAKGDPLLWTLHQNKLYLNYNKKIHQKWQNDKINLIVSGDQNWPSVLN